LFAIEDSVDSRPGAHAVQARANELLDREDPGAFNQAMMELGALVCRPVHPLCDACPVSSSCAALSRGDVLRFPIRDARRAVPHQRIAVGVVSDRDRVLITRRAEQGMLGGLWEFPGGKVRRGEKAADACRREILEETGLRVDVDARIARVKHVYSHLEVMIDVFHCRYLGGSVVLDGPTDHRWITLEETANYAFPKANHKFLPTVWEALTTAMPAPVRKRRRVDK
jgi:A/G-specific adenine glycosylase